MSPDPRYVAALAVENRKLDALARCQELLLTHPDLDPVERLHLIRTLSTIDRRTI